MPMRQCGKISGAPGRAGACRDTGRDDDDRVEMLIMLIFQKQTKHCLLAKPCRIAAARHANMSMAQEAFRVDMHYRPRK